MWFSSRNRLMAVAITFDLLARSGRCDPSVEVNDHPNRQ